MIDYYAGFDAEERLYGYHIGGYRPAPRPHPADEKREAERRIARRSCADPSGCVAKSEWFDENGIGFCGEHAR